MMQNHFANSPSVGSHDNFIVVETLNTRILHLEHQLKEAQARQAEEEKPRRFRWGKIGKFFNKFFKPVIDTISRLLNAIANLKRAFA